MYTHTSFVLSLPSLVFDQFWEVVPNEESQRAFLLSKDWKLAHSKGSVKTSCCLVVFGRFSVVWYTQA